MYLRKYPPQKIWLDKNLKAVFQRTLTQRTRKMVRETVAIGMTAHSQSLLNAVKVVAL